MFFNNFIKRILSSLLRPWLEQDLELDLQLGFINSTAVAKNIRFDTSTLNRLIIDGSSSSRFFFKEFVIEEFVVRFSNWSDSAFVFEARGVKVTMSLEEMEEEGTAKVRNSSNAALESLKKDLSLIDPEVPLPPFLALFCLNFYCLVRNHLSMLHLSDNKKQ